jgi:hypothetical protein
LGFLEVHALLLIQAVFIKKEIANSYRHDAVFVSTRLDVIPDDNDFPEGIADAGKRSFFLPRLIRIAYFSILSGLRSSLLLRSSSATSIIWDSGTPFEIR